MSTLAFEPFARIEELEAKQEEALGYATRLLEHFVDEHFPYNPDWKPLPELVGVLTQLDNAMTIARDYKARIEVLEGRCGIGIAQRLILWVKSVIK